MYEYAFKFCVREDFAWSTVLEGRVYVSQTFAILQPTYNLMFPRGSVLS